MLSALVLALVGGASAQAQAAPADSLVQVPTTRVMAIGRLTAGTDRAAIMPVLKQEVPATVKLYLAGKLDQWFSMTDQNGVVFILNVTSVEEAHALLEKLPLGQKKMMEFQLIPLGPLAPLRLLLQDAGAAAK